MGFITKIWELIKPRLLVATTLMLDTLLFLFWVFLQHVTGYILSQMSLEGTLNEVFLQLFQWTFGTTTFLAVVSYLIRDFQLAFKHSEPNTEQISEQTIVTQEQKLQQNSGTIRRLSETAIDGINTSILSESKSANEKKHDDTI